MANGRSNKTSGYCDYQFEDGTYCKEKIAGNFLHESGQIVTRTGWGDIKNQKYCLFHSHFGDKGEFFYPAIIKRIEDTNIFVKKQIEELSDKQLTKRERKKREQEIRRKDILDFEGFYFPKKTDFKNRIFQSAVCFFKVEFSEAVDFNYTQFKDEVSFGNAVFGGVATFESAKFSGVTDFRSAIIRREADFDTAMFGRKVDFAFIKFDGKAQFLNAKFAGEVSFYETKFVEEAGFNFVKFRSEANFNQVRFGGEANFNQANFNGVATFQSAEFGGEASFFWTTFRGKVDFLYAMFNRDVFFRSSLFHKSTSFFQTTFMNTLDFADAAFLEGKLDFAKAGFPAEKIFFHNTVFNSEVSFYEQMLKGVRFTGCYLGSASFYGSDVRDAVFINSSWNRRFLEKQIERLKKDKRIKDSIEVLDVNKKSPRTKRRAILFDEKLYITIKKNKNNQEEKKELSILELDYLYLEHLYCQFKLAMDNNKMYSLANDFYYGEKLMETKRLWEEGSFLKWSFLKLYKLLAGFGNSPWRAIISLILILFASSFLLIWSNSLTAVDAKAAYERCHYKSNKEKTITTKKYNLKTPVTLAKTEKSLFSVWIDRSLAPMKAFTQSSKLQQSAKPPIKVPLKKEAVYSLKDNYLCNAFYISLWNLTASPGRKSGDFKEKGWIASLAVFLIQYIFRPLMVALIIISVRRKVYRG